MIKELCTTLKNRLSDDGGLAFIDVYSGLVQAVKYKDQNADGNPITKVFPVSYDTNLSAECGGSPERALTPDSSKNGIVYFEENGSAAPLRNISGGRTMYKCAVNLVCWFNRNNVTGDAYSEIGLQAFSEILKRLKSDVVKSEVLRNITITEAKFSQNARIFDKYSYDETVLQYLRPPFDFFYMELTATFILKAGCAPAIILNPKNC